MAIHIRPTATLAERALLTEDPGGAMALAHAMLERPLMLNHNRGLWGYTGVASDGLPLTIQSTGMGGPSAAIVLEDLVELGLRRAVRVGTCGSLEQKLELGELIIAESAIAGDGAGRALAAAERADADAGLSARLRAAATGAGHGLVASTDLFYRPEGQARWAGRDGGAAWREAGVLAVDMETATLFALGGRRGIAVACILVVGDRLWPQAPQARITDKSFAEAIARAGRLAVAALDRP